MKLAFVFPGQGSQSVGMLSALAEVEPLVRQTFEEASAAVDVDLWTLSQSGPEAQLNQTENTQPALLAAGIAVWRVWQHRGGPQPSMMAGHSLGEYTALVAAGALALADGIRLVAKRGRLMQEAVPTGTGGMAAIIGLGDAAVDAVCAQAAEGDVVSAANLNSPGQVVIAGSAAAVDRAVALATEAGARRAILLAVSVPSHCDLMRPAAEGLAEPLRAMKIQVPKIPVVHNANVAIADSPEAIRDALIRQLYQPVRWVECVNALRDAGVSHMAECGPGKVLAGLVRRIDRTLAMHALVDSDSIDAALADVTGGDA